MLRILRNNKGIAAGIFLCILSSALYLLPVSGKQSDFGAADALAQTQSVETAGSGRTLSRISLMDMAAIPEKDIDKRPPQTREPVAPHINYEKESAAFALIGTIGAANEHIAIIRHASAGKTVILRPGDPLDRFQILSISSKSITLGIDGFRKTITLPASGQKQ